jgi:hypothetical protein
VRAGSSASPATSWKVPSQGRVERALSKLGLQLAAVSDEDVARVDELADLQSRRAAIAAAMRVPHSVT